MFAGKTVQALIENKHDLGGPVDEATTQNLLEQLVPQMEQLVAQKSDSETLQESQDLQWVPLISIPYSFQ